MQPERGIEGTRPPAGGKKEPSGLFFSAPGCGSQHPRVPWAALASCWPLPQQLLPASATGRGRRCCRSHPVGMSTVVAAAALRKGVFNLTRTGIVAELTAASEQRLPPVGGRCRIATKRGVQGSEAGAVVSGMRTPLQGVKHTLGTIREDEDAAAAIGINPTKYKVIAVVISAIIAGLVGFFYVSYIRYIDPDIMIQSKSTEIVLPAVVGGAAYIEGPLIGGLIMIPLSELLRANFAAILPGINMLMYAIVLIVVIRFRPSGILGWYMNSKVKTFIDEKILKKPSLDVLEEYELMADKGGK